MIREGVNKMSVVLYTTYCPKCKVLKEKLDSKNISYKVVDDMPTMIAKGFLEAPKLEIDGQVMNFVDAINWVNAM